MTRILAVFVIGMLLILAVSGAYYAHVGLGQSFSPIGEYWAEFGNYFGGVAGPLLSFISILLLVYTIHLQHEQLSDAQHETLKRDLLAHVTKADDEIIHWLERELAVHNREEKTVQFGDVVWGLLEPAYVNRNEFKRAAVRLHRLTSLYCEALALYQDNIDTYFIAKYHRQKAQALLNFLKEHGHLLGQMAAPSIKLCQMHLDGQHEA